MMPLILTVFLASVAGGLHCVGMCGAFLGIAVGGTDGPAVPKLQLHSAYHLGRLLVYTTLGAVAGAIGGSVDLAGRLAGFDRAAAMIAGAFLVLFGIKALLGVLGLHLRAGVVPAFAVRLSTAGHRAAFSMPPLARAASIGVLTTLLPCAWLWAFVFVAAGTANPFHAALTMAAFWAGTLPLLGAFGFGLGALLKRSARAVPLLTSVALIGMGAWTMTHRLSTTIDFRALAQRSVIPATHTTVMPNADDMPCCNK